jgi:c-di-GMP-binding flagellar brake protein YcgR
LNGAGSPRKAAAEPAAESAGRGNYAVTDGHAIVHLLDLLQQRHALLSAHLPAEPELYSTAVIGVFPERDFFLLDELSPRAGHEKLLEGSSLTVFGRLDGVGIRFSAPVQEVDAQRGLAFYKCRFPLQVQYLQRRSRHRISLVGAPTAFSAVCGRDLGRAPIRGTIHDLCADGLGLLADGEIALHRGEVLASCSFRIAREGEFRVALEVRHAAPSSDRRHTRIGARILDPDRPTRRRLEAAIARLERELARRNRPE